MFEWLSFRKRSRLERWGDRARDAWEQMADSVERGGGRATELADSARRQTGAGLREARGRARELGEELGERGRRTGEHARTIGRRARELAQARREALAERVESLSQRAAEIRRERGRQREERRERRREETPMRIDLRERDRVTLRGRRPIDVQFPGGKVVRYRFYERPSRALRALLHLRGRQIWPPK